MATWSNVVIYSSTVHCICKKIRHRNRIYIYIWLALPILQLNLTFWGLLSCMGWIYRLDRLDKKIDLQCIKAAKYVICPFWNLVLLYQSLYQTLPILNEQLWLALVGPEQVEFCLNLRGTNQPQWINNELSRFIWSQAGGSLLLKHSLTQDNL